MPKKVKKRLKVGVYHVVQEKEALDLVRDKLAQSVTYRETLLRSKLASLSPEEAAAWVENEVTDLASAKELLKVLTAAVVWLIAKVET